MPDFVKGANLALAFALELAMLAAFAVWALSLGIDAWLGWGLALVLVAAAVGVWAIWGAPKSFARLAGPALLAFKLIMFALAVIALVAARQAGWAVAFAVLAAVNLVLARLWHQQ